MTITIASRFYPFSHMPGIMAMIPKSSLAAQIFPSLVRLYDVSSEKRKLITELELDVKGPVDHFMVVQDLERAALTIFSEKKPMHLLYNGTLVRQSKPAPLTETFPRLSLGSHKLQVWEKMRSERDFFSIFPLWHRLGLLLPKNYPVGNGGMFSLLEECRAVIDSCKHEHILAAFEKLFLAGFGGLFVPRLFDEEYLGIVAGETEGGSPLALLAESARLIHSLFIQEHEGTIALLPHLPSQFFSGRFIDLPFSFGKVSMEWSKKELRRVQIVSEKQLSLSLRFPPSLRRFRLRMGKKGKTFKCSVKDPLELNAGSIYLLDCFEK